MEESKRKQRLKPYDLEEEWDWNAYQKKTQKQRDIEEDEGDDALNTIEGDENGETKGKQEQAEGSGREGDQESDEEASS